MKALLRVSALIGALALAGIAYAQAADPAATRVSALSDTLVTAAKTKGAKERKAVLAPAMGSAFNYAMMSSFIVGPDWAKMPAADQAAITQSVSNYLVARFAQGFGDGGDVRIRVLPDVQNRGPDKLVRTIVSAKGEDDQRLDFRLREAGGAWQVIDVINNSISELSTQRADLAGVLKSQGPAGLAKHIQQSADKLSAAN